MSTIVEDAIAGVQSCLMMLVARELAERRIDVKADKAIQAYVLWHSGDDQVDSYIDKFGSHLADKRISWMHVAMIVDDVLTRTLSETTM